MYEDPLQLGPDRWAALIGAHALSAADRVVVCMGTATTIDALTSAGNFLGGMILPGFDLMHAALERKTARLGAEQGQAVSFPRSTRDAITTGAVRATCGAIACMHDEMLRSGCAEVSVLATGGAAPAIVSMCRFPVMLRDKLVLEGLVQIGKSLPGVKAV
jgi:type III pantothenate kinase